MSQNKLHSVFMVIKEHVVDVFFRTFWAAVGVSEPLRTQHLEVAVHRQLTGSSQLTHSLSLPASVLSESHCLTLMYLGD